MVKNAQKFEKKLGSKIMEDIAKAKVEEWDISLLARLLLDDPGIMRDREHASNAASKIRARRNEFVHKYSPKAELSQSDYKCFWRGHVEVRDCSHVYMDSR